MNGTIKIITMSALLLSVGATRAFADATEDGSAMPADPNGQVLDARLFHVPPSEAEENAGLVLVAEVDRGWTSAIEVRYRPLGTRAWKAAPFELQEQERYVATVPSDTMMPPGIEYFIAGIDSGGTATHFANAESPHKVFVYKPRKELLIEQELAKHQGRRAQVRFAAEFVDYGVRRINGRDIKDSYYRIDTDFSYRLMALPLRAIRIGYTRLIGTTPSTDLGDGPCADSCEEEAGFRAGGWLELRFRLGRVANFDGRVLLQATQEGFGIGGRGELRFGDDRASHFALGAEAITAVGSTFFARLGWDTVPRFPMSATIEISDYPASHRATGVRLIYDVAYDLGRGLRIGARTGYQARDQGIGGATVGLNATFDF